MELINLDSAPKTTIPLNVGDMFTIDGVGFDRKGRAITNGAYNDTGKKTRAKIVRQTTFKVVQSSTEGAK